MTPAELTLTAALGAAFLTALGSLGVVWLQESRNRVRWQVTSEHDRVRVLNERFTAAAAQLGDHNAAIRLAGVHAMAGLADDWPENRQTCGTGRGSASWTSPNSTCER